MQDWTTPIDNASARPHHRRLGSDASNRKADRPRYPRKIIILAEQLSEAQQQRAKRRRKTTALFLCTVPGCSADFTTRYRLESTFLSLILLSVIHPFSKIANPVGRPFKRMPSRHQRQSEQMARLLICNHPPFRPSPTFEHDAPAAGHWHWKLALRTFHLWVQYPERFFLFFFALFTCLLSALLLYFLT